MPGHEDEAVIREAIVAARVVQDYLWGERRSYDFPTWRRVLRKRIDCLDEVDLSNPHALTEVRKRVLQSAAVSVAWLAHLDREAAKRP